MKDGDGKPVDYTEQSFHFNTTDKRIKLSVSSSTVATYSEGSLSFGTDCTPVPITATSPEIEVKAYAKAKSGNVISKVDITIGYEPAANLYKYFKVTETTESDINFGVPIIDETLKIFFSHEAVKVSFYFGSVENINSAYVTVGNKDINLTKDSVNKLMYFTVAAGDSQNDVQNLKDATITTKRILTIQKNAPIKTDQSDDVDKIVAKLQAPTKLAYSWSNGDPQGKYIQDNNTLTVTITDSMFSYTKDYYTQEGKGLDLTLFTLNKDGVETQFTYSSFVKGSGND